MSVYEVRLEQFEGPLDLLLHLVLKAKVDIQDIFVSSITEQYMEHMRGIDSLDIDSASEFIEMAATLLYIKSRSLLPKPEPLPEDEEDPEQALIRRLNEYKQYKEAGEKLKEMELDNKGVFYKLPEEFALAPAPVEFVGVSGEALRDAFIEVLSRRLDKLAYDRPKTRRIRRDEYSVSEKRVYILKRLKRDGELRFSRLFDGDITKPEMVATFLALLELINTGEARARQLERYGEIIIKGCGRKRDAIGNA
ncbi:MAG: segregation and condensation protein A [Christensenellales bacterium]|jgi:segregation and condensation protein A